MHCYMVERNSFKFKDTNFYLMQLLHLFSDIENLWLGSSKCLSLQDVVDPITLMLDYEVQVSELFLAFLCKCYKIPVVLSIKFFCLCNLKCSDMM